MDIGESSHDHLAWVRVRTTTLTVAPLPPGEGGRRPGERSDPESVPQRLLVRLAYRRDVSAGLAVGRHAAILRHRAGAGVVGGEGEIEISVERVEQRAQIARSA